MIDYKSIYIQKFYKCRSIEVQQQQEFFLFLINKFICKLLLIVFLYETNAYFPEIIMVGQCLGRAGNMVNISLTNRQPGLKFIIFIMGGVCPIFAGTKQEKERKEKKVAEQEPKSSDRKLSANIKLETKFSPAEQNNELKKKQQKIEQKLQATNQNAITTTENSNVKSVLAFQTCQFDNTSILKQYMNPQKYEERGYYTLIDKLWFVKKTQDTIRVSNVFKEIQLNCPLDKIGSVYYIAEGIPCDTINIDHSNKIIVQTKQSPINAKITLVCKNCESIIDKNNKKKQLENEKKSKKNKRTKQNKEKDNQKTHTMDKIVAHQDQASEYPKVAKKVKMTFCSALVESKNIICDQCQSSKSWRLLNIESNFPAWGDGKRIRNGESLESLPSQIRFMGCISCIKYLGDYKKLPCSCLICFQCYADKIEKNQCQLCKRSGGF